MKAKIRVHSSHGQVAVVPQSLALAPQMDGDKSTSILWNSLDSWEEFQDDLWILKQITKSLTK